MQAEIIYIVCHYLVISRTQTVNLIIILNYIAVKERAYLSHYMYNMYFNTSLNIIDIHCFFLEISIKSKTFEVD